MEINNINSSIIKTYKSVTNTKAVKEKDVAAVKAGGENVDKIEFDFERSIAAAKTNIASSADAEANTAKIEQLQKLYAGDNCPVDASQIANAIVD